MIYFCLWVKISLPFWLFFWNTTSIHDLIDDLLTLFVNEYNNCSMVNYLGNHEQVVWFELYVANHVCTRIDSFSWS